MQKQTENMAGIIEGTENNILFYNDKYIFTFMPAELVPLEHCPVLHPENGFLYAISHGRKKVAIYSGTRTIEVYRELPFHTSMYLESEFGNSDLEMHYFDRIVFQGGVLNNLKQWSMKKPEYHDIFLNRVTIERQDEKKEYTFLTPECNCKISIGNHASNSWGAHESSLKNDVYLSIDFDKRQSIISIKKHYEHVNRLISIMTNRAENHFDIIYVTQTINPQYMHLSRIQVNIEQNEMVENRKFHGIYFEDLGDSVARILQLFYNSKNKKPSYSLGFIPKNDAMHWHITDDIVRSVCAGIECEISFYKEIETSQEEALKDVCKAVRKFIKHHQKINRNNPILTDGTYELIKGSINNWTMSAFEKTKWLFSKYENAMKSFSNIIFPMPTDEDIHEFIKYRNNITHGAYQEMTDRIEKTTVMMQVLIICSLLHRCGVSEEMIADLCKNRIGY